MRTFSARVRAVLSVAVTVVAVVAGSTFSVAQSTYPDRPVRVILPFGPGGVADVTMRLVAQKLTERLGQNFYIENRPGAGGIAGAKGALSYPADGYTFYLAGNGTAISQTLFKDLPYNILTDFVPVTFLAQFDMLLATKADSKHDSVQKLVAYGKANPGKLNFGTVAAGSTQHLSAELFKMLTGVDATMIMFKTTPDMVTAIIRGDIDVGFDFLAAFRPSIASKQIKIIATGGEKPNAELPGVPTVKDSGYPDYLVTSWNALQARAGTPPAIIKKMNEEVNAVLALPEIKTRMADLGMEPLIGTSEQMGARMANEIKKWAVVIEKAGIPTK
ncbi:MAG: tripartite tricarboxylate transporter substrate-binding protein [Pseudolabrys sp.]|nr:tripartite tricarboxylate transporter substrate-binding protein [Pseudolabrys sp.]